MRVPPGGGRIRAFPTGPPAMSISAKYFKAYVDGTFMTGVYRFDMEETGDELDATTAANNGYAVTDTGVQQLRFTASGFHIIGSGPWPGLSVGTILEDVYLYEQSNTAANGAPEGPYWYMAEAIVTRGGETGEVRGRLEWTVNIASRGEYQVPQS